MLHPQSAAKGPELGHLLLTQLLLQVGQCPFPTHGQLINMAALSESALYKVLNVLRSTYTCQISLERSLLWLKNNIC